MKTLYTDASFDYHHTTKTTESFVRGKIAVADGNGFARIEKVIVGKVPELKQYINILELTAVARAVELASLEETKAQSLAVYTDSKTAMIWARNGKIKADVSTEAHANALEYLRKARIQFGGIVTFNFIGRDENPAGKLLEAELEREAPHAI